MLASCHLGLACQNNDATPPSSPLQTSFCHHIPLSETLLTYRVHQCLHRCYDSRTARLAWARQPINTFMLCRLSSRSECGCERQFLSSGSHARQATECGCSWRGRRPLKIANVMDIAV
jgi:hypothetical protein